jgi:putative acetyltransferase
MNVAHHDRNESLDFPIRITSRRAVDPDSFKARDPEVSPPGRKICIGYLLHAFQRHSVILRRIGCLRRHCAAALTGKRVRRNSRNMAERQSRAIVIAPVDDGQSLSTVRALLLEYWESFGFTPCFQNFDKEVAGLPGSYVPPAGRLALARVDGEAAGCVALRRVDAHRAEPKRLYVRKAFRGLGLGKALLEWVMDEARKAGYTELVGDTMPEMRDALALYDRMGFERVGHGLPVQASQLPQISHEPILIRIKL